MTWLLLPGLSFFFSFFFLFFPFLESEILKVFSFFFKE